MSERPTSPLAAPERAAEPGPSGAPPAAEQTPAPASAKRPRRGWLPVVGVLALIGVGVGGFKYMQNAHDFVSTNNAYVRGDILTLSAKIPGRLAGLYVSTGDRVTKGQLLGELDAAEIKIQLLQAEANLAAARAALGSSVTTVALQQQQTAGQQAQAGAGVQAAQRNLEAARVNARRAQADFDRLVTLYREGGVSRQQYETARASAETARAQAQAASAQVEAARAASAIADSGQTQVRVREQAVEASRAQIAQAEAAVAAAKQQLANTRLVAPIDGIVAKKALMGGEMVSAGQAIAELVDPDSVYIEAMIDETHVAHVQPGEAVDVAVDAYPGRKFQGHVAQVGAATGSEFALIPQNNASGSFTKVVQRMPVKIQVENPNQMLKPGMSSVVAIDVRGH